MYLDESWISGTAGSGGVFLSGCTHACVFCQNHEINREHQGTDTTPEELAQSFLDLQRIGCHNLHWVTPTHQLTWLLEALDMARRQGLTLPLVYNTGGYESAETLRHLEGIVDIYVPDFKFWDEALAWKYVRVRDYPETTRIALLEMKRQVGHLQLDACGLATRGLIVRHLVMPGFLEDARRIYDWIASELGTDTYLNILPQYTPMYRADRYPEINRKTSPEEWREAMALARAAGLHDLHPHPVPEPSRREQTRRHALLAT